MTVRPATPGLGLARGYPGLIGTDVSVKLIEPPSTDATLSALTVSLTGIIGFASDRTSYEIAFASTVTQATIVPTTERLSPQPSGTAPPTPTAPPTAIQVSLSAGRNAVTVFVTAAHTTTNQTYTLSINRGVDTDFGWKASGDFDGLITAGNEFPRRIWSDGTTMWRCR